MTTLLQQLENNEAVLLMYLADELPAEDRAEVEHLLANDERLRAELAELEQVHALIDRQLAEEDARTYHGLSESAVRRASRVIHAGVAQQAPAPRPPTAPSARLAYPWWSYPVAAAAAVLLAFLVWWGNSPSMPERFDQAMNEPAITGESDALSESFADAGNLGELEEIEAQMASLYAISRPGPELWDEAVNQ